MRVNKCVDSIFEKIAKDTIICEILSSKLVKLILTIRPSFNDAISIDKANNKLYLRVSCRYMNHFILGLKIKSILSDIYGDKQHTSLQFGKLSEYKIPDIWSKINEFNRKVNEIINSTFHNVLKIDISFDKDYAREGKIDYSKSNITIIYDTSGLKENIGEKQRKKLSKTANMLYQK